MKIYWIKAQAPLRVLSLAKHLGLKFESKHLELNKGELKSEAYTRLNPNKKAPVLVDGDVTIWESAAIMVYLSDKAGSDLWPSKNVKEQIEIIQWISWGSHHWDPAVSPYYFEHIVKPTLANLPADRKALEGKEVDLNRWASVLDEHLKSRRFVACDRLTIADFYLGSMARYWKEAEIPLQNFSHVTKWLEHLMTYPAWREPWPDGPRSFDTI